MAGSKEAATRLAAIGVAVLAHTAIFLLLVGLRPEEAPQTTPPVLNVQIMSWPKKAEPRGRSLSGAPVRTSLPEQAAEAPVAPVAPLGTEALRADEPAPPASNAAGLRQALRRRVGCAHAALAQLTAAERDACEAHWAEETEAATYRPPLTDQARRRQLEAAAARKAAYRDYRQATAPPLGIDTTGGGPTMARLPGP